MKLSAITTAIAAATLTVASTQAFALSTTPTGSLAVNELWTYSHLGDGDGEGGAEINAYDSFSNRVFVTNAAQKRIDVIDNATGSSLGSLALPGGPNSVTVHNGVVAVAVENNNKQLNGTVEFYNAATSAHLASVTAGALPDMLTFTPDGSKVIVANEGEPSDDYTVDPVGSIGVIDLSSVLLGQQTTVDFSGFSKTALQAKGVQIFGPGASAQQDLEPEYVAVSPDGTQAFITLQENNAIAYLDLTTNTITDIKAIEPKDYSLPGNEIDASDKDGIAHNQQNWSVTALAQPDAIAAFEIDGDTYFATANEGDAREYEDEDSGAEFVDEIRVGKATIDPALEAALVAEHGPDWQENESLGRMKVSIAASDIDGDGDLDKLVGFGNRSFSIFDDEGTLVFDSGDFLEDLTEALGSFNDKRSDDKGPEPEALVIEKIFGKTLALLGLERTGDVLFLDLSDPANPELLQVITGLDDDISPEGLTIVDNGDGTATVFVSDELGSTTRAFGVTQVPVPAASLLFGSGIASLVLARRRKA